MNIYSLWNDSVWAFWALRSKTEQLIHLSGWVSQERLTTHQWINSDTETGQILDSTNASTWFKVLCCCRGTQRDCDQQQIHYLPQCFPSCTSPQFFGWLLCFQRAAQRTSCRTPSTLWKRRTFTCSTGWRTSPGLSETWNIWSSTPKVEAESSCYKWGEFRE